MAKSIIAITVAAGNASDATVFTMPASYEGFIGSITAANSTGGSLNLTLKINRNGTDFTILQPSAVGATTTVSYNKGAVVALTPIGMIAGDVLKAQGSGAGLQVNIAGLRFSV